MSVVTFTVLTFEQLKEMLGMRRLLSITVDGHVAIKPADRSGRKPIGMWLHTLTNLRRLRIEKVVPLGTKIEIEYARSVKRLPVIEGSVHVSFRDLGPDPNET